MSTHSTGEDGSDPRRQTLAFRLTSSEREQIDALARADGVSASEFARRAVFGQLRDITSALDEAREEGREELRPRVAALQDELALTRGRAADWQRHSGTLQRQLDGAPQELLTAVTHLVAGGHDAKGSVALRWSRIGYRDRVQVIPVAAAVVADKVDQALAALPFTENAIDWLIDLLDRLEWLTNALIPEPPRRSLVAGREIRGDRGPIEAVYVDTRKQVVARIEVRKAYESLRPTNDVAE